MSFYTSSTIRPSSLILRDPVNSRTSDSRANKNKERPLRVRFLEENNSVVKENVSLDRKMNMRRVINGEKLSFTNNDGQVVRPTHSFHSTSTLLAPVPCNILSTEAIIRNYKISKKIKKNKFMDGHSSSNDDLYCTGEAQYDYQDQDGSYKSNPSNSDNDENNIRTINHTDDHWLDKAKEFEETRQLLQQEIKRIMGKIGSKSTADLEWLCEKLLESGTKLSGGTISMQNNIGPQIAERVEEFASQHRFLLEQYFSSLCQAQEEKLAEAERHCLKLLEEEKEKVAALETIGPNHSSEMPHLRAFQSVLTELSHLRESFHSKSLISSSNCLQESLGLADKIRTEQANLVQEAYQRVQQTEDKCHATRISLETQIKTLQSQLDMKNIEMEKEFREREKKYASRAEEECNAIRNELERKWENIVSTEKNEHQLALGKMRDEYEVKVRILNEEAIKRERDWEKRVGEKVSEAKTNSDQYWRTELEAAYKAVSNESSVVNRLSREKEELFNRLKSLMHQLDQKDQERGHLEAAIRTDERNIWLLKIEEMRTAYHAQLQEFIATRDAILREEHAAALRRVTELEKECRTLRLEGQQRVQEAVKNVEKIWSDRSITKEEQVKHLETLNASFLKEIASREEKVSQSVKEGYSTLLSECVQSFQQALDGKLHASIGSIEVLEDLKKEIRNVYEDAHASTLKSLQDHISDREKNLIQKETELHAQELNLDSRARLRAMELLETERSAFLKEVETEVIRLRDERLMLEAKRSMVQESLQAMYEKKMNEMNTLHTEHMLRAAELALQYQKEREATWIEECLEEWNEHLSAQKKSHLYWSAHYKNTAVPPPIIIDVCSRCAAKMDGPSGQSASGNVPSPDEANLDPSEELERVKTESALRCNALKAELSEKEEAWREELEKEKRRYQTSMKEWSHTMNERIQQLVERHRNELLEHDMLLEEAKFQIQTELDEDHAKNNQLVSQGINAMTAWFQTWLREIVLYYEQKQNLLFHSPLNRMQSYLSCASRGVDSVRLHPSLLDSELGLSPQNNDPGSISSVFQSPIRIDMSKASSMNGKTELERTPREEEIVTSTLNVFDPYEAFAIARTFSPHASFFPSPIPNQESNTHSSEPTKTPDRENAANQARRHVQLEKSRESVIQERGNLNEELSSSPSRFPRGLQNSPSNINNYSSGKQYNQSSPFLECSLSPETPPSPEYLENATYFHRSHANFGKTDLLVGNSENAKSLLNDFALTLTTESESNFIFPTLNFVDSKLQNKLLNLWCVHKIPLSHQKEQFSKLAAQTTEKREMMVRQEIKALELQLPLLEMVSKQEFILQRIKNIQAKGNSASSDDKTQLSTLRIESQGLANLLKSRIQEHERIYQTPFQYKGIRYSESLITSAT